MREKEIEEYLRRQVARMGGLALKFTSPGHTGVPDRLVILPGGKAGFLELKAPGRKPRPEQHFWGIQLRDRGCLSEWADSREDVDRFLRMLSEGRKKP